jgi:hypothetical protein
VLSCGARRFFIQKVTSDLKLRDIQRLPNSFLAFLGKRESINKLTIQSTNILLVPNKPEKPKRLEKPDSLTPFFSQEQSHRFLN